MIVQQALEQVIAPVMDALEKTERDLMLRDLRIMRLRMALEFIRDHDAHPQRTRIYAESALEADEVMS
jgi:hypothetical protein